MSERVISFKTDYQCTYLLELRLSICEGITNVLLGIPLETCAWAGQGVSGYGEVQCNSVNWPDQCS